MLCCWRAEQSLFGIPAVSGHSSCAGEETSAVVDTGGGDLGLYALSIMDFLLFSMKNILRKCKEQAVHGWTAGKDNSFFMMFLLPLCFH